MAKEYDVFQKDYATKSTSDIGSKPTEMRPKEKVQNQTVTGGVGLYDRSKPYRYFVRAKVINNEGKKD